MFNSNRIRIAAAITAGFVAAAAIPAYAAAAPGAEPERPDRPSVPAKGYACLDDLTVNAAEDWGADEPYLEVDGDVIWDPEEDMDDGSSAAVNRTVRVGAVVKAYESDHPDPNDFLGSDAVESDGGTMYFDNYSADYELTYSKGGC